MFRYLNLRNVCGDKSGEKSRMTSPLNFPDKETNGKNVVFIHGYNEDAQAGLGNIAETFKRFFWSGSRAKFTGVTWYGNDGSAIKYHQDVRHALDTAKSLQTEVDKMPGEMNVIAFSLGNMLASSAIHDHDMKVDRYFMLHAAVASEAYDGSMNAEVMVRSGWKEYAPHLRCSEWHSLFSKEDHRSRLAWRNRFNKVVPKAYNFYSSGEDVLEMAPDSSPGVSEISSMALTMGRYAWIVQELTKGSLIAALQDNPLMAIPSQDFMYGGWSFNVVYGTMLFPVNNKGSITGPPSMALNPAFWVPFGGAPEQRCLMPAVVANAIPMNNLKTAPFFFPGVGSIMNLYLQPDNPSGTGSQYAGTHHSELMAEMIPATSHATGVTNISCFLPKGQTPRNFNMQTYADKMWPEERLNWKFRRWLHGDYRLVAYLYTHAVFDKIRAIGGYAE
jgi:hypothetical protein